jgi:pimeloyl-ACP methyl ester carboxylesterase
LTTRPVQAGRTRLATAPAPFGTTTAQARAPKLILLPGLHGTCALMAPFMTALGEGADVQALDYPRDRVLDHAALAEWVRPQLPVDKPFVLLGESFSGPVALRLAADRPRGLRALVLSTSFAASPRPALRRFAGLARAVPAQALPVSMFTFWLLGRWTTPALRAQFAKVLAEVDADVLAERLVACLHVDVTALLPQVQVPLLYLRGRKDRLVPPTAAEVVAQRVKDTRIVDFDAPHCLLQAVPAQAAKAVGEFVAALAPR